MKVGLCTCIRNLCKRDGLNCVIISVIGLYILKFRFYTSVIVRPDCDLFIYLF